MLTSGKQSIQRLFQYALIIFLIMQIMAFWVLLQSEFPSDDAVILGRYGARFGFSLVVCAILLVIYTACVISHKRIFQFLSTIPSWLRWMGIYICVISVPIFWSLDINITLQVFFVTNSILAAMLLVLSNLNDADLRIPWLLLGLFGVGILLFYLLYAIVNPQPYAAHDEAIWADFATSFYRSGSLTALHRHYGAFVPTVQPGIGWSVTVYGWLLENFAMNELVGRIWNYSMYFVAIVLMARIAMRLYGWKVSLVSVMLALASSRMFPIVEYRPDHQLTFISMFALYASLNGRMARRTRNSLAWHFVCGLIAVSALQFHAMGILFAVTFSLLYAVEVLQTLWQEKRLTVPSAALAFGIGALVSTMAFWLFNIIPAGGFSEYWSFINHWSPQDSRYIGLNRWQLEQVIFFGGGVGFLYIGLHNWREHHHDRFLAIFVACLAVSIPIVDGQRYSDSYYLFFLIGLAILLMIPFGMRTSFTRNSVVMIFVLWSAMMSFVLIRNVNWQPIIAIAQGQPIQRPYHEFIEINDILHSQYLKDGDVVVSSPQLIWNWQEGRTLISVEAELFYVTHFQGDPITFWEELKPNVIARIDDPAFRTSEMLQYMKGLVTYIDVNGFMLCDQFNTDEYEVQIWRQTCSD